MLDVIVKIIAILVGINIVAVFVVFAFVSYHEYENRQYKKRREILESRFLEITNQLKESE